MVDKLIPGYTRYTDGKWEQAKYSYEGKEITVDDFEILIIKKMPWFLIYIYIISIIFNSNSTNKS